MKKMLFSLVAATCLLFACNKNVDKSQVATTTISPSFSRSAEDNVIASYVEESFEFSSSFAEAFGYSSISIDAGDYTINKDLSTGKYYTILNIKDLGTPTTSGIVTYRGGVRIVKRSICKHHHKSCCCPLGFKCGFIGATSLVSNLGDDIDASGEVDSEGKQVIITFTDVTDISIFKEQ